MENKIRVIEISYNEGLTGTAEEIAELIQLVLSMKHVTYSYDKKLTKIEDMDLTVKWITIPEEGDTEEGKEE